MFLNHLELNCFQVLIKCSETIANDWMTLIVTTFYSLLETSYRILFYYYHYSLDSSINFSEF